MIKESADAASDPGAAPPPQDGEADATAQTAREVAERVGQQPAETGKDSLRSRARPEAPVDLDVAHDRAS